MSSTIVKVLDVKLGCDSEVGTLRTVILHRPGAELQRLTPRNNDALLFDGLPWVSKAQEEHDAFTEVLESRAVEVLLLADLLTDRSEERRVGKECRSRWASCRYREKNIVWR